MNIRRITPLFLGFLFTYCASYTTKPNDENPKIAVSKMYCKIEYNPNVREIDKADLRQILSLYDSSFSTEHSTLLYVKIKSIYKYRGARGLELFTGLSLGLIPSWTPAESEYHIEFAEQNKLIAAYEIYRTLFEWLLVIPFAYWPTSNEERLAKELRAIFERHCTAIVQNK